MLAPRRLPLVLGLFLLGILRAEGGVVVDVEKPMPPPDWALLERELLRANERACVEYFNHYFDDRGFLECVERWGGDDGPDDAIENLLDWPVLHALGASDDILLMYKKAWEGHIRQFTAAKTTQVDFARDGMYYKEFPVMFDWLHNGEGLVVFNVQGLSDPLDVKFGARTRRFAGFYMNEDPGAPNYDPKHKIIRSIINGSRGPMLRKATGLDWAGDPIEVENRFKPRHGEHTYAQMIEHFKDYNDVVGDSPENLSATTLALNAFMLTGEAKYRDWLLEYVDAWRGRIIENGGIVPSNVGLDGKIGSSAGGKWYGGVYGWAFSVHDPGSGRLAHRNLHGMGIIGFVNAYMLTGDDKFLDAWRKQIDIINSKKKLVNGREVYPRMYGDQGWYEFGPQKYEQGALEIYYLTMRPDDRARIASGNGWLDYVEGKNPAFPESALRADVARIRGRIEGLRKDPTTRDTRLSDDPMPYNPASVNSLVHLALGGISSGNRGTVQQGRLRYFDPVARRAGFPPDVAALIDRLTADETSVTVVNVNQTDPREVVVQAGCYAEHQIVELVQDGRSVTVPVNDSALTVRLAPGSGVHLTLKMKRYANPPTMSRPWDRKPSRS